MHDRRVPVTPAQLDRLGVYRRNGGPVYWIQHKGRRFSLKTTDAEAALLAAQRAHRKAADPTYAAASEKALGAVAENWLTFTPTDGNRRKPPSPETLEMYSYHIGHLNRLIGAETPLVAVDADAIDRYVRARREETIGKEGRKQVSARTVDKELGTLRQILRFALRRGWYHKPLEAVLPESAGGAYEPLNRWLPLDGVRLLLAQLPEARAATCAYIVATNADWSAVERAERYDLGTARMCTRTVMVRGSKNPKRWREVPVVAPFGDLLEQPRAWLLAHGSFPPWGNSTRDLAAACKRAGVPRVTVRDLRRSHGKILRARGVSPHLIGSMLGHVDSRMAELVYARIEPEDLARLVATETGRYTVGTRR
jgi:integrase